MTVFMSRPSNAFAPAIALLNPAVLGAVVVAGGVMAGAAAHYAPATYSAGQAAVDSLGTFSRTLYQAEKYALTSGAIYAVGRAYDAAFSLGAAGSAAWDWIADNASEVPNLFASQSAAAVRQYDTVPPYAVGQIVESKTLGIFMRLSQISNMDGGLANLNALHTFAGYTLANVAFTYPFFYNGSMSNNSAPAAGAISYVRTIVDPVFYPAPTCPTNPGNLCVTAKVIDLEFRSQTGGVPTVWPTVFSPSAFKNDFDTRLAANGSGVAGEIDKVIAANPGAVTGPPSWTSADSGSAQNLAAAEAAKDAAITAKAASDADPTNIALKIAAAEAQDRANQKAIEAQTPVDTPLDPPLDLSGTYSPESLTNDYAPDTALNKTSEFTDRFNSFVGAVKATSLFSLPNQVLFNIPNSSTSIYTVNMGSYGTVDIDFSSFGSALTIFRSALLICFAYASLRIAATGK